MKTLRAIAIPALCPLFLENDTMTTLWIEDCEGATTEDVARGISAAYAVFVAWRLTPEHCHAQVVARAEADAYGERGCAAWDEAESAAIRACCDGWVSIPDAAHLALA